MSMNSERRPGFKFLTSRHLVAVCEVAMLGCLLCCGMLLAQEKPTEVKTLIDLPASPNSSGFRKNETYIVSPSPYTHYSFEEAVKAQPSDLAIGIVELWYAKKIVPFAKEGATVYTWLNESRQMIDELNVDKALADIDRRLEIYGKAVNQRRSAKLNGSYDMVFGDQVIPTLVDNRNGEPWWWDGSSYQPIAIVEHSFAIKHYTNTNVTIVGEIRKENNVEAEILIAESALFNLGKPQPLMASQKVAWHFHANSPDRYAKVFSGRATYFMVARLFEWALADANSALAINNRFANAYGLRSQIYSSCPVDKIRDGKHALEDADKYCEHVPDSEDKWRCGLIRASAFAELGNFDAAVSELEMVMPQTPEDARPMLLRQIESYKKKVPFRM